MCSKLKNRILIVEDNPCNQAYFKAVLRRLGLNFDIAENGQLAIEQLLVENYTLVIMDIMMPIMDGITATAEIRKTKGISNIPIIGVSANWEKEGEALNSGMNSFLIKPVKMDKLILKIEQSLNLASHINSIGK